MPRAQRGGRQGGGLGEVQSRASQRGRQGAGHTACSPAGGSGLVGVRASPLLAAPSLRAACGRTWPLRSRRSRGRSLSSLPAGGSPASPHSPLSPSLPGLPILGLSIISQSDGHLSRSAGLSLCPGCRSPSLFQRLLRPP